MAKKNQKDLKIKPLETDGIFQVTLGTILFTIAAISDRKSTRLNSSHSQQSRMPSSA